MIFVITKIYKRFFKYKLKMYAVFIFIIEVRISYIEDHHQTLKVKSYLNILSLKDNGYMKIILYIKARKYIKAKII